MDTLNPLEATLLGPLRHRANMSRDPGTPFTDPMAETIVDELGVEEVPLLKEQWMTDVTTRRTTHLDRLVEGLLDAEPGMMLVNVGAGLCTRKYRVPAPAQPWVDLDSAAVIGLRRRVLTDRPPRSRYIAGALEDDGWLRYLPWTQGEPIAFVAEGVLAYLAERDVRTFLERVTEACPGAHILFDTFSAAMVERVNAHNKAHGSPVRMRWSPKEPTIVRTWHRHLLVSSVVTMGPDAALVHARARR